MTITIQRQRQGVSKDYVRQFFLPCPHGHEWHWQRDHSCSKVSYPNCNDCYGEQRGQLAWRATHTTEARAHAAARKIIKRLTGQDVEFSDDIEHYCYSNEAELRIWPHLADDVYIAAAVYEVATNTIRHVPTNVCLIAFGDTLEDAVFDVDSASKPYRELCRQAYAEFCKDHNQRQGERDSRGWLAWYLSELIKHTFRDQNFRKMASIVRDGEA